ncbi:aldose 1-/glucose-6-phosphate 1-epimerase [Lucifera butyrica]|uniref:Aldose 1-/glucose-6-phosphate 1-epimerase n=1 Tax=Lucifera butyrica TaxID=1351585 RepID=A0A498RFE5_9FIRM|nr:aldose 1-epimerase family protein [Lucifera butyrica]VBB08813.1 aldose 1-/glucose-6-phosphate 1-epimerase [Lucifera butyrica]
MEWITIKTRIENGDIYAVISNHGAELLNLVLKKDDIEYLWSAQPDIWARHAPVLFPIVGKLKNNRYKVGNQNYEMFQHGFARDMEFEQIQRNRDKVCYRLASSDDTLLKYPYKFQLDIVYSLQANSISCRYSVKNIDSLCSYFSIGAHPGFNCPLLPGETIEDYYLEFEKTETAERYWLKKGLVVRRTDYLENEKEIALSTQLFNEDALIFKNLASTRIGLKSKRTEKSVTVDYTGFPYLGIWSKPGGAPFICIEPWYGITDNSEATGQLTDKEGILALEPGQEFTCEFKIIIT